MVKNQAKTRKRVIIPVAFISVVFLAAGAGLGLWLGRETKRMVADRFNQEQLTIAQNVARLIERELAFLKREILMLREDEALNGPEPTLETNRIIQLSLTRVIESGVWKIEIVDLEFQKIHIFTPNRQWYSKKEDMGSLNLPGIEELKGKGVWVSQPQVSASGIRMTLASALPGELPRVLLFNVNISWFLSPFLRDIRSGQTGYSWVIDQKGRFLYHPRAEFLGKDAFEVRDKAYPGVPLGIIDLIQKDHMLKGEEGTGWYFSGWHRGITGKIKKLIAYCPVVISRNPPQFWSVAVVAPVFEIEGAVHRAFFRQFLLQGLVILAIIMGASTIILFELRWSRSLEREVEDRTKSLRKSEEKYRSLVESAEDFIFTVDSKGLLLSMNTFTANFFGGSPEQFIGKDLSCLFPAPVVKRQLKSIDLVVRNGKSVRDEFDVPVANRTIWLRANYMPLRTEEGGIGGVLCIARDVTTNKNLQMQLINAEKLASLGTLAAGVAHEINNPLAIILGFCDLLLQRAEKGSQEYEDLKTIERQGLHCKEVVENLLSFARAEEGESQSLDLNRCLEEVIAVVRHTLEMNDIDLVMEFSEGRLVVEADSRRLQQVFVNLINNAVAAMQGGGTLTIRTMGVRDKAVIQFQDNGVGIPGENMEHIFEPFFTTKPEGEGTGLGLFVSYGIIASYGGNITCESKTGDSHGTTFTVIIPIQVKGEKWLARS